MDTFPTLDRGLRDHDEVERKAFFRWPGSRNGDGSGGELACWEIGDTKGASLLFAIIASGGVLVKSAHPGKAGLRNFQIAKPYQKRKSATTEKRLEVLNIRVIAVRGGGC
jgi:hypothetical protein